MHSLLVTQARDAKSLIPLPLVISLQEEIAEMLLFPHGAALI
jgi:hypothetical protein